MSTLTKNRFGKLLMSLGVACLTSTSSLLAQGYNNSFGFDLTQAADPVQPVYLCDGTEIGCPVSGGGEDGRQFTEDGTWVETAGAVFFTVTNLPSGTYDITISGDGPYSGGQYFTVSSDGNSYTSDLSHGGATISDFQVTAGQPLNVTAMAAWAFAYASGISFYGPKPPPYDNSFGFDLTQVAAPVQPVYLPGGAEIDCPVDSGGEDGRQFTEDGTWVETAGAIFFSVDHLPPGTYDIVISGDGPYSGGQYFTVSSGDNTYTSALSHGSATISDFQVTDCEPLDVTAMAAWAFAYMSDISFYGPKSPCP